MEAARARYGVCAVGADTAPSEVAVVSHPGRVRRDDGIGDRRIEFLLVSADDPALAMATMQQRRGIVGARRRRHVDCLDGPGDVFGIRSRFDRAQHVAHDDDGLETILAYGTSSVARGLQYS